MPVHILPSLLSLGFFIFLMLLGRSFFALLRLRLPARASWLLAPAMGLALLALLVGLPNQAGLPIASFGRGMVICLTVVSIGILVWRRCAMPWSKFFALLGVAVLWHLTAGYPLLRFGYDWVSYANNDYTNYCFMAARLLNHGFFAIPTAAELHGKDLSVDFWFIQVARGVRPGTDFVLAAAAATFKLTTREAFMPVILAFGLAQACALGGMLALSARFRQSAIPGMLVLLAAPLFGLGIYYQLFAQVGGLALMLLTLGLLCKGDPRPDWRHRLSFAATCGVALAALFLFYPESAPFALIPAAAVNGITLIRQPSLLTGRLAWVTSAGIFALGLLGINVPFVFAFLKGQMGEGSSASAVSIFPYFVNVEGWAKLMGWSPFYGHAPLWMSVLAAGLAGGALLMLIVFARRCRMVAALAWLAALMGIMTVLFFLKSSGFGLFKLAMFAQPVLAAGLAIGWRRCRPTRLRTMLALGLLVTVVPAWKDYGEYALGKSGGPCDAPFVSEKGFPPVSRGKHSYQIVNMGMVLEKLAVLGMRNYFSDPVPLSFTNVSWGAEDSTSVLRQSIQSEARHFCSQVRAAIGEFPPGVFYSDGFRVNLAAEPEYLVEPHPVLSPFNRFDFRNTGAWFSVRKTQSLENRLAWMTVSSMPKSLDETSYMALPESENTAAGLLTGLLQSHYFGYHQLERDVADKDGTFCGSGRFLLFSVIRPTTEIYVRIAFTRTYCQKGRVQLSENAKVCGEGILPLGLIGSGSANIIVGPLKPHHDMGRSLIFVDLGSVAQRLSDSDDREISGWIRDVSALSPKQYQTLKRPTSIGQFPKGILGQGTLEYSGIYEDGWMDKKCWVILEGGTVDVLHLSGMAAELTSGNDTNNLIVSMNGVPFRQFDVSPGNFDHYLMLPMHEAGPVRISLEWQHSEPLKSGDDRPVAALIHKIELVPVK